MAISPQLHRIAVTLCLSFNKNFFLLDVINKYKTKKTDLPKFFNIDFWFKENVIYELAKIKKCINDIKPKDVRNLFLVALSETVRYVSNTRNGEFKLFRIPKEKLKNHNPDVLSVFKKRAQVCYKAMEEFYNDADARMLTTIIQGDSTKKYDINDESIDLILTSPPYGDSRTTVAYGQFSRLSSQWLDMLKENDSQVDKKLLGGETKGKLENNLSSQTLTKALNQISKTDSKRAKDVLAFYVDLNQAMQQAHRVLKKYKYFCLVVGNRTVKKIKLETDYIISELGENLGFQTTDTIVRNIPNKRMPLKNSPTNVSGELENTMHKESIVILQKL